MKTLKRLLFRFGGFLPMRLRIGVYRLSGMKIGKGTKITKGIYVDRPDGVIIGDNCFFNHFVHLHNGADPNSTITFGNNVFVGPDVHFFCASHKVGSENQRAGENTYSSIVVEDGVWIGADSTVFPGVTIGVEGIIGGCSFLTKSTKGNCLYYGSPAELIRKL